MPKHLIWWLLTMACVIWYIAITWYVAIRGAKDIKEMLARLRDRQGLDSKAGSSRISGSNEGEQAFDHAARVAR